MGLGDALRKMLSGATPLHAAARKGDRTQVEALLVAGADPHARRNNGWTPLLVAFEQAGKEMISLLRRHGAAEEEGPFGSTRDKGLGV